MSKLVVDQDGTVRFIYSDDLRGLLEVGTPSVTRASHVEPCALGWIGGGWTADLTPVKGPVLGPFETRQEALDAEVHYLNTHVL